MKKLLCLTVVMLLAVNVSAVMWVGTDTVGGTTAGDGTWGDINGWVTDAADANPSVIVQAPAIPSSSDNVVILGQYGTAEYGLWPWPTPNTGPALIDSGFNAGPATINGSAVANDLRIGYWGYTGTLNVSSTGTLNVGGMLAVGYANDKSTLNNAGTINVAGNLIPWCRYDSVINNTGTMNIGGIIDMSISDFGTINLDGGTITAAGLKMDPWYQDRIDITEGALILDGDWVNGVLEIDPVTGVPNYNTSWGIPLWTHTIIFAEGTPEEHLYTQMTAYNGAGTIMYDYDNINPGQTTIWAVVPEPATMSLLGLGAVALLRRKK